MIGDSTELASEGTESTSGNSLVTEVSSSCSAAIRGASSRAAEWVDSVSSATTGVVFVPNVCCASLVPRRPAERRCGGVVVLLVKVMARFCSLRRFSPPLLKMPAGVTADR